MQKSVLDLTHLENIDNLILFGAKLFLSVVKWIAKLGIFNNGWG